MLLSSSRSVRQAAITASTLFAMVMAIVAGLIFALVFKTVILDRGKTVAPPPPPTRKVTVAASNILDKTLIAPGMIKQINLTEAEYEALLSRSNGRQMLVGNQPIGRTTRQPVKAEEPVFEDQLEPLAYPEPVSNRLSPGKRAVVVAMPANAAMVQVGDRVDVVGTLEHNNSAFGNVGTTTAVLARNLRVIARFGSTMTAVRPRGNVRTYTLEASPYRANVIELAKSVGATFSLSVNPRPVDANALTAATEDEADESEGERVTLEDLARIFGIQPPAPPPPVWTVERFHGVHRVQSLSFPGYHPGTSEKPASSTGNPLPPTLPRQPSSSLRSGLSSAVAAASGSRQRPFGFQPVGTAARSCPTCSK